MVTQSRKKEELSPQDLLRRKIKEFVDEVEGTNFPNVYALNSFIEKNKARKAELISECVRLKLNMAEEVEKIKQKSKKRV